MYKRLLNLLRIAASKFSKTVGLVYLKTCLYMRSERKNMITICSLYSETSLFECNMLINMHFDKHRLNIL